MKNETKPGDLSTILGKGSEFEGKIKVGHTMRVDGKVVGDIITTDMLIIGKRRLCSGQYQRQKPRCRRQDQRHRRG